MNAPVRQFVASPEQADFLDWIRNGQGSGFVEAVAGSGKTTALIEALKLTQGSVSFAAYNTKIVREIREKVAPLNFGNRVRVGTFHSFGLGAWRYVYKEVEAGPEAARKKWDRTWTEFSSSKPSERLSFVVTDQLRGFVQKLVGLGKQGAVGLIHQIDDDSYWYKLVDHFDLAYEIEAESDQQLDVAIEMGIDATKAILRYHRELGPEIIDFDDMLWLPVISGIKVWQNPWVFVDEAQDTNPARRALARKMLMRNGRAVFVGDRHQAIYGFTGADSDSIDQIIRDFDCTSMPLTTTFRCPKEVVKLAQTVVSHIQAAPTAPEGSVRSMEFDEFSKLNLFHPTDDAILCRNTKPLVQMAYSFIKRGVPCHVEGKDIGAGLLKLVNRFSARTLDVLKNKLTKFLERETQKLIAKGRETQAENLADRIETVFVIMDDTTNIRTVDDLRNRIMSMFQDSEDEVRPTLTLCTAHRSKGREWKRVFLYGKAKYMPSGYARQAWQLQQENNLIYVAYTRAMEELILVSAAPE